MGASDPIKPHKTLVPRGPSTYGPRWLIELLKRKAPKLAAVALANKMARIAWKLMTTGESYDSERLETRIDAEVAVAA